MQSKHTHGIHTQTHTHVFAQRFLGIRALDDWIHATAAIPVIFHSPLFICGASIRVYTLEFAQYVPTSCLTNAKRIQQVYLAEGIHLPRVPVIFDLFGRTIFSFYDSAVCCKLFSQLPRLRVTNRVSARWDGFGRSTRNRAPRTYSCTRGNCTPCCQCYS